MRLPASVVVMGGLTSLAFGLAIRAELRGPGPAAPDQTEAEHERAAIELTAAKLARMQRVESLHVLYRDQPIQNAFLHGHVKLGTPMSDVPRGDHGMADPDVSWRFDGDTVVDAIHITVVDRAMCDELEHQLEAAWGFGIVRNHDGRMWLDPPGFSGARAALSLDGCKLDYDRYTPVAGLVAKTSDSIVPLSAIGNDATQLAAQLTAKGIAVRADSDAAVLTWSLPALGTGRGRIELQAVKRRGKIVQLIVAAAADSDDLLELEDTLTIQFRALMLDGHGYHWPGPPRIDLVRTPTSFTLSVGEAPR